MEFVVETISLSCEFFFCGAVFVNECELFSFVHNCVRKTVFHFICAVLWKLHGYHRIFDTEIHVCDCIYMAFKCLCSE